MRCEDAVALVADSAGANPPERRAALQHSERCTDCADALRAVRALHRERRAGLPSIAGGFERALAVALRAPVVQRTGRGFWLGAVVGAAVAAAVAAAALVLVPATIYDPTRAAAGVPEVQLTVNERRDVSIALDSPVRLDDALISVTLNGAVELQGYAGQRSVQWSTDIASGVNELTLPVVATGPTGGQLAVEVRHGDRRRVFVVDVRATNRPPRSAGV